MYEHKKKAPLSRQEFTRRVLRHGVLATGLICIALGVGILGYHFVAGQSWIDSLLNASMILGGMGPVGELTSDGAKVFASIYALFSGLIFIGVSGIIFAPFAHRLIHVFQWGEGDS